MIFIGIQILKEKIHISFVDEESDVIMTATTGNTDQDIKDFIDTEDNLYKEMMYRIVDDQDPVEVMENIVSRIGETSTEMERLLTKMSEINPYKYKEQTYSDDDEEIEM